MKSIRRHLLISLLVGLTILLTGAGAAVYHRTRNVLTGEFDTALHSQAAVLAGDTEYDENGRVNLDTAGLLMPEFNRDAYYQARVANGDTIARSPSLGFDDLPQCAGDIVLPNGRLGRAVIVQFIPLPAEDRQPVIPDIPQVTLVVARDRAALDRTLAGILAALVLVGAVMLAATAIVVTLVVRRGLTPLDAIGHQAATIDAASLQTRFATDSMPVELQPIAGRLNDLLARLDEAFQRERRVTADIAHELRTPIAELRTLAEVGAKWPDEASFQDALQIAQRMETLVTGLLALARHESGHQPLVRAPVDLRQLVHDIWQPLAPHARQLDVAIEVTGQWQTDPALLRLIVGNLLANAVEYTPLPGKVRVAGNDVQLEISNSVDGLTREDLPHLFERFWRKDAARADDEHSGLGLALAHAAANALGMKIEAEMPEEKTLRVTLR